MTTVDQTTVKSSGAIRLWVILLALALVAPRARAISPQVLAGVQAPAKVWVNTSSGVYHCPGTRWYGTTKSGNYLSEPAARGRGYRPAYGRTCGPLASSDTSGTPLKLVLPGPAAGVRVWVNTSSGVYHCPGTRYYGNTVRGKYLQEPAARAAGNRPAYGRACS
jgi:hypothetical protein